MAEPEQGGAAAFIRDAPFRVVLEIVRRLPARSAIRIRSVCKPWRDVTAHPALLAVLHRLQPPQPLICFRRTACPNRYIPLRDYCVEALNLRSDKLRSIFRFTDYMYLNYDRFVDGDHVGPIDDFAVDYDNYEEYHDAECLMPRLTVHASLDGLLVVSFLHAWYVCNPATRRWVPLPDLSYCDVVGFYKHVSSGKYRVMYQIGKDDEHVSTYYYVLTVGTRLSRIIGCPISPEAPEDMGLDIGLDPARFSPPVQLRCNLHWPPQERQGYHILVFNTESELFNWMSPPVRDKDMRLLEIEGKLALSVSRMNKATLELWRLEDYQNEIWVQMFRIQLAVAQMTELHREDWSPAVVSPEGDLLIECPYRVLHCDRNGNLLQKFRFPDEAASARHALRVTSCTIHAWEINQSLEGADDVLTALTRVTLFSKLVTEIWQEQMVFDLYLLMDIVARTDVTTVIRMASTCKLLRQCILMPSFLHCLNLKPTFASCLLLGHFFTFRDNIHTVPRYVRSPFSGNRFVSEIKESLGDEIGNLHHSLDDFSAIGQDGSFMVLRKHNDPLLCIWNPVTNLKLFLPMVPGITRRSSCILQVKGVSFHLVLIKLRLNQNSLETQTFIAGSDIFTCRKGSAAGGTWTEVAMWPIPLPTAKIAKPRAFPVALDGVAYWLCKSSGKYCILKVLLGVHVDPTFLAVPKECSSVAQFPRNDVLLVPASRQGRIGLIEASSSDGLIGLVAIDNDNFNVWVMTGIGHWVLCKVIPKDTIFQLLRLKPSLKPAKFELICCANKSGIILVKVAGRFAVLSLNTLDAVFVERTEVEKEQPLVRIRGICPYEFDIITCLSRMKHF